jgi:AcrR family transcriptional regulator
MPAKIRPSKRVRLDPDIRRGQIVVTAFDAIANDGFEGLRTRDIAASAGINSATLHHYFPTKEDLVAAVAGHLEQRFRLEKTKRAGAESAREALRHQFEDTVQYYSQCPTMLAVYRELVGRAPRDRSIRRLVERLHSGWRADVMKMLERGRNDGSFRSDLDCKAAANILLCTMWGLVAHIYPSAQAFRAAMHQVTAWLEPQK